MLVVEANVLDSGLDEDVHAPGIKEASSKRQMRLQVPSYPSRWILGFQKSSSTPCDYLYQSSHNKRALKMEIM